MGNFFPASARHAKAREFLELKQGTMIVLEYVAKFTELASFADDYVATDVATPEPGPTRLASPNRNPGDARLKSLFKYLFLVFY